MSRSDNAEPLANRVPTPNAGYIGLKYASTKLTMNPTTDTAKNMHHVILTFTFESAKYKGLSSTSLLTMMSTVL